MRKLTKAQVEAAAEAYEFNHDSSWEGRRNGLRAAAIYLQFGQSRAEKKLTAAIKRVLDHYNGNLDAFFADYAEAVHILNL